MLDEIVVVREYESLKRKCEDCGFKLTIKSLTIELSSKHPVYAEGNVIATFITISEAIAFISGWMRSRELGKYEREYDEEHKGG